VLLLLALPFLIDQARRRHVSRVSHRTIVLGLLWLFGLVLTDVYRGSAFHDYSRGWSNIAFLLLSFAALSLLIDGHWRRVTLFAAGVAMGEALQFLFNPSIYATAYPWKFGYGHSVTLAGVLLASSATVYRRTGLAAGILISLAAINLNMGFRSLGGACLLAALVLLAPRTRYWARSDGNTLRMVAILAASACAGIVVVVGYEYAAAHGTLGGHAQQKYAAQKGRLGIIVGGRPEIISESLAIRDSPIVGHGSWAKGPEYGSALRDRLFQAGYSTNGLDTSSGLIPTHSYLFGAWVDGGVLGAVFWLWTLVLVASFLPQLRRLGDGRVTLVAFLSASFVWDVLFSPLGAQGRLTAAFSLVVFLMAKRDVCAAARPRLPR
jgi:hypothetical protein